MSVLFALLAGVACGGDAAMARDDVYRAGVERRTRGDETDAIAAFQSLLARDPNDIDARLQLGLALAAAGQSAKAGAALEEVLRAAPNYDDARVALARLALAEGNRDQARALLAPALRRGDGLGGSPGRVSGDVEALSAELDAWRGRGAEVSGANASDAHRPSGEAAAPRWRLDAAGAYSALTGGLADWREVDLSLSRKIGPAAAAAGRVETLTRFSQQETYLEGEYDRGWSGGEWFAALGGSLDPTFRPEAALKGGITIIPAPHSPWRLTGDANFSRYVVGNVTTLRVSAERILGADAATLGARWITTFDERDNTLEGYALEGSWRATPGARAFASFTDAPESSDGRTTPVKALALGADMDVDARTALHVAVTEEQRHAGYDRLEFSLGVTKRF